MTVCSLASAHGSYLRRSRDLGRTSNASVRSRRSFCSMGQSYLRQRWRLNAQKEVLSRWAVCATLCLVLSSLDVFALVVHNELCDFPAALPFFMRGTSGIGQTDPFASLLCPVASLFSVPIFFSEWVNSIRYVLFSLAICLPIRINNLSSMALFRVSTEWAPGKTIVGIGTCVGNRDTGSVWVSVADYGKIYA